MKNCKIFRRPEVENLTGLATSTLYTMMSKGEFPRPIKLTGKAVGWLSDDVEAWLASRKKSTPLSLQ